jgi:hypothetical protein
LRLSENQDPRSAFSRARKYAARKTLEFQSSKVGFPIRKSADQSSFATPRGLSQRTTSFIASQRQGIHQMLLRHLIALIVDAHPSAEGPSTNDRSFAEDGIDVFIFLVSEKRPACFANHPGMWVSIAPRLQASTDDKRHSLRLLGANVRMICFSRCHRAAFPPRTRQGIGTSSNGRTNSARRRGAIIEMVEPDGIEPTTSCLQSRRSPN